MKAVNKPAITGRATAVSTVTNGMASGIHARRYHSLPLANTNANADRVMFVNGLDGQIAFDGEAPSRTLRCSAADVMRSVVASRVVPLEAAWWSRWRLRIAKKLEIEQEIYIPHGSSSVVLAWKLLGHSSERIKLRVRLLLSGHNSDTLRRKKNDISFRTYLQGRHFTVRSYPKSPAVVAKTNAFFLRDPAWYCNFRYQKVEAQGLDATKGLASPGIFGWDLNGQSAVLVLIARGGEMLLRDGTTDANFARRRSAEFEFRRFQNVNII